MQLCLVKDAIDLHKATIESIKLTKMLVYSDHRYGYEIEGIPSNVVVIKKHKQIHVDGHYTYLKCGLKLNNRAVLIHKTKYCLGRSTSAPV